MILPENNMCKFMGAPHSKSGVHSANIAIGLAQKDTETTQCLDCKM